MDITKLSLQELKALGYDLVEQLTMIQANLQLVQTQIKKLASQPKETPAAAE